jgi:hypothetical protein
MQGKAGQVPRNARESQAYVRPSRARKGAMLRYFITFACHGGRLHGHEAGSVDCYHNLIGSRLLEPDSKRAMAERRKMLQNPYV